jgi:hypothetical protein
MNKELEETLEGIGETKGFVFTRVDRSSCAYLYKVDTGASVHYEIFERRATPICIDFEQRIYSETDTKEIYPKSNDFGVWAWSTNSISRAIAIFQDI